MEALNEIDLDLAYKQIDLGDEKQDKLFTDLRESVSKLKDRDELDILPTKDNKSMKEAAEEIMKTIKGLFSKLFEKFANRQTAQLNTAAAPTPNP